MVLGKLSVPGRPIILITVGQGSIDDFTTPAVAKEVLSHNSVFRACVLHVGQNKVAIH